MQETKNDFLWTQGLEGLRNSPSRRSVVSSSSSRHPLSRRCSPPQSSLKRAGWISSLLSSSSHSTHQGSDPRPSLSGSSGLLGLPGLSGLSGLSGLPGEPRLPGRPPAGAKHSFSSSISTPQLQRKLFDSTPSLKSCFNNQPNRSFLSRPLPLPPSESTATSLFEKALYSTPPPSSHLPLSSSFRSSAPSSSSPNSEPPQQHEATSQVSIMRGSDADQVLQSVFAAELQRTAVAAAHKAGFAATPSAMVRPPSGLSVTTPWLEPKYSTYSGHTPSQQQLSKQSGLTDTSFQAQGQQDQLFGLEESNGHPRRQLDLAPVPNTPSSPPPSSLLPVSSTSPRRAPALSSPSKPLASSSFAPSDQNFAPSFFTFTPPKTNANCKATTSGSLAPKVVTTTASSSPPAPSTNTPNHTAELSVVTSAEHTPHLTADHHKPSDHAILVGNFVVPTNSVAEPSKAAAEVVAKAAAESRARILERLKNRNRISKDDENKPNRFGLQTIRPFGLFKGASRKAGKSAHTRQEQSKTHISRKRGYSSTRGHSYMQRLTRKAKNIVAGRSAVNPVNTDVDTPSKPAKAPAPSPPLDSAESVLYSLPQVQPSRHSILLDLGSGSPSSAYIPAPDAISTLVQARDARNLGSRMEKRARMEQAERARSAALEQYANFDSLTTPAVLSQHLQEIAEPSTSPPTAGFAVPLWRPQQQRPQPKPSPKASPRVPISFEDGNGSCGVSIRVQERSGADEESALNVTVKFLKPTNQTETEVCSIIESGEEDGVAGLHFFIPPDSRTPSEIPSQASDGVLQDFQISGAENGLPRRLDFMTELTDIHRDRADISSDAEQRSRSLNFQQQASRNANEQLACLASLAEALAAAEEVELSGSRDINDAWQPHWDGVAYAQASEVEQVPSADQQGFHSPPWNEHELTLNSTAEDGMVVVGAPQVYHEPAEHQHSHHPPSHSPFHRQLRPRRDPKAQMQKLWSVYRRRIAGSTAVGQVVQAAQLSRSGYESGTVLAPSTRIAGCQKAVTLHRGQQGKQSKQRKQSKQGKYGRRKNLLFDQQLQLAKEGFAVYQAEYLRLQAEPEEFAPLTASPFFFPVPLTKLSQRHSQDSDDEVLFVLQVKIGRHGQMLDLEVRKGQDSLAVATDFCATNGLEGHKVRKLARSIDLNIQALKQQEATADPGRYGSQSSGSEGATSHKQQGSQKTHQKKAKEKNNAVQQQQQQVVVELFKFHLRQELELTRLDLESSTKLMQIREHRAERAKLRAKRRRTIQLFRQLFQKKTAAPAVSTHSGAISQELEQARLLLQTGLRVSLCTSSKWKRSWKFTDIHVVFGPVQGVLTWYIWWFRDPWNGFRTLTTLRGYSLAQKRKKLEVLLVPAAKSSATPEIRVQCVSRPDFQCLVDVLQRATLTQRVPP